MGKTVRGKVSQKISAEISRSVKEGKSVFILNRVDKVQHIVMNNPMVSI